MKIQARSFFLGFIFAFLILGGVIAAAFVFVGPHIRTIFHDQALPSGKVVKVTMCHFAWGVDHTDRHVGDDSFVLEYVSTVPHTDLAAVDRETVETFELIRPISELWGLSVAQWPHFQRCSAKGGISAAYLRGA
ncbi:MAG: hypothetical protein AB1898_03125 [Acidobacteriota bacterium]